MQSKRRDNKGRILRQGESQRKDGKYMYRYTDPLGSRRTIYSWKLVDTDKCPDGKRCVSALRDMEKDIDRDLYDGIRCADAKSVTVNQLFNAFIESRLDLRTTTRRNYITLYNKHVKAILGDMKVSSVRHSTICSLYSDMIYAEKLAYSTALSVHSFVYQIFEMAVKDNLIRNNPAADAMKKIKSGRDTESDKRHALTEREQEEFINYVYGSDTYKRWGTLFTVLLGTGMRIGEALGLRWEDCDFKDNLIYVTHILLYKEGEDGHYEYRITPPKTKSSIRVIPMLDDVRRALLRERGNMRPEGKEQFSVNGYTNFIFLNNNGRVFTPATVFDAMRNIVFAYNKDELARALDENREPVYLPKFSPHILRHTFCTRACENEQNVKVIQEIMGHKNISTTMDVYNEATIEKKRESIDNLNGKFKIA